MISTISQEAASPEERKRRQARARRLVKRVDTLVDAGRLSEAVVCQSEVADLRPDDWGAFLRLGLLHREMRHLEPAVSALRRASNLNPDGRGPREALLETLLEARHWDEAIAEARALVKVVPRSLYAREALRLAYIQTGDLAKAAQTVSDLIHLNPAAPEHRLERAMLWHEMGNISDAVAEFTRVIEIAPEGSPAAQAAAETLEALDDNQISQIILLATEDRLFCWNLRRDPVEASQGRGYVLSQSGQSRLRAFAHQHLADLDADSFGATTGVRRYH